jgi:VWFA-related protein
MRAQTCAGGAVEMTKQNRAIVIIAVVSLAAYCLAQQQTPVTAAPQQATQASATPPRPVYEPATVLKVKTRLVVVDVVATDKKGNPVVDLKAEDFALAEDLREQKIRVFNFQHPTKATESQLDKATLPPNVFTNVPSYNVTNALNVLLLDGLNTKLMNQVYARAEMVKFLQKLPPNQPVAVYALGTKLWLLQDFTTDPTLLKKVINEKKINSPLLGDTESFYPPSVMEQMPSVMLQRVQQFQQDTASYRTDVRVRLTLDALKALARTLSGYPGRKNLIWLSETFPFNIFPDVNSSLTAEGGSWSAVRDYSRDVMRTADILTDAQIAVYPVDARGLVGGYSVPSEAGSGLRGGFGGMTAPQLNPELNGVTDSHGTMDELANRTGGRAFYHRNDLDTAVLSSVEDGSTYYTLAYYPENKDWNGKFRKIRIKTNRAGVMLRHRLGYFASDPQTYASLDAGLRTKEFGEALSLDFPSATQVRFQATVLPPSQATKNKLLLRYLIDPHAISYEAQADGSQHALVECAVIVYSKKGQQVRPDANQISAALLPDAYKQVLQRGFPCEESFDLPAGDYVLRMGVRDGRSGLIGTTTGSVTVAPAVAAAVQPPEPEKK